MKYCFALTLSLISLFSPYFLEGAYGIFMKDSTIAHPETGLFFDYVGLYTPSETIIHNSAIFPMTTATCHFLPLSAAETVPSCNITTKRHKRLVGAVISLGIGAINLAISTANTIQLASLQQQVALVEKSLTQFSQTMEIHGAQLAKIESNQIELAEQLLVTQQAFDSMIPILNSHSDALKNLIVGVERLHMQFKHSFLYLAISQIFRNQLTLEFLSPEDLHKVVYHVIEQGKLIFNSHHGSLPLVHIITKLLVRQQIDFIPSSKYSTLNQQEIGRLVITSFFAVPRRETTSFYTYKLLAIPFSHENETIQLAHIPKYWAINSADNTTIEWHDPQESGCDLQLMTSCRDTPPLRSISNDTCFGQIIRNLPLSSCQTAPVPSSAFFLRQLRDNLWVTSSLNSLYCLKIPRPEYSTDVQQTWNMNEQIILPPVALVNVTPGYTIACPGFTLVGRPIVSNTSSLITLYHSSLLPSNISVVNVYQYLTKNTTWFKAGLNQQRVETMITRIRQPINISTIQTHQAMHKWSFGLLMISWVSFGLIAISLYCVFRCKRRNSLQKV